MKVNYVLCAAGNLTLPVLNIDVVASSDDEAKKYAAKMVEALSKADYLSFYLYNVQNDHYQIASFKVEVQKPIVTIR